MVDVIRMPILTATAPMAQGKKNLGWRKKQPHATVLYNICTYLHTDWKLWATPSVPDPSMPSFEC